MSSDNRQANSARLDAMLAELSDEIRAPLPDEPFRSAVRRGIIRGARYRAVMMAIAIGAGLVTLMPLFADLAAGLRPLLGEAVDLPGWRPREWVAIVSKMPTYLWALLLGGTLTVGVLALDR